MEVLLTLALMALLAYLVINQAWWVVILFFVFIAWVTFPRKADLYAESEEARLLAEKAFKEGDERTKTSEGKLWQEIVTKKNSSHNDNSN